MSLLNNTVKKIRKNYVQTKMMVEMICDLDKDNKLSHKFPLQRDQVWTNQQRRKLISTILEGDDLPKFFLWDKEGNSTDGVNPEMVYEVIKNNLMKNLYEKTINLKIMDGYQRLVTLLMFYTNELRTESGLVIDGRDIGNLYFKDLPDNLKEQFLYFDLDITLYSRQEERFTQRFQNLNSGVRLTAAELTNSHNNMICNYVREKASIHSKDQGKFACFRCDENGISKLLRTPYGKRKEFDKILKQCMIHSLIKGNIFEPMNITAKSSMIKLSKSEWLDLSKIPIQNEFGDQHFNLSEEVETLYDFINQIVMCPRKFTKIVTGVLLTLYIYLSHLKEKAKLNGKSFVLSDPVQFSKEFFGAHMVMNESKINGKPNKEFDKNYFEDSRRGSKEAIQLRIEKIENKLKDKNIGIKFQ